MLNKDNINKLPIKYWDNITILNNLQRTIVLHSYIYYELDNNVISDNEYKELVDLYLSYLKKTDKKDIKKTNLWYVFKDFNGSTGFDLFRKLEILDKAKIKNIANIIVNKEI